MRRCHLCHEPLCPHPMIELKGMPKAAQYYPTAEEFHDDHGIDLRVYQCGSCGLAQLNMAPVDYYKEVITAASLSPKARAARLADMQAFVQTHDLAGKKVLELGSGNGGMLEVMEEAGMQATGLEAGPQSVATGLALGRRMICGYLGDMETVAGAPFEAFISLNYLEHLPDPDAIIRQIYRLTTDQAVGFVTVPNLAYLLRSRCFYEFVADHLSYFTTKTLTFAFEKNGFDVLSCHTINNDNDVLAVVKKRAPVNLTDQYQDVEHLIHDLRAIVARYKEQGKKVAVWGAGHRTLALLALADVQDLAFIIDSAQFKQGRFAPVLHKIIVGPDTLQQSDVSLVIVMVPGIYPGEVIKTIQNMALGIEVASLVGNKIEFL